MPSSRTELNTARRRALRRLIEEAWGDDVEGPRLGDREPPKSDSARAVFARLLDVVRRVPRGRVATYGQVARVAGLPRHARHVGWALHALPAHTSLPWHRILGAGGVIRVPGDGSADTQRLKLHSEGVRFDARGRVPLERYGWKPAPGAKKRGRSGSATGKRLNPR